MTLVEKRLVLNHTVAQQNYIKLLAIVKAADSRQHQTVRGIEILAKRHRGDSHFANRKILHQPVLRAFSGKEKVRADFVSGGAQLRGNWQIASVNVAGRLVTMVRRP